MGICGEHGGDPAGIEFCDRVGLNYVSCSPYRVPVARLAAAQAALKQAGIPGEKQNNWWRRLGSNQWPSAYEARNRACRQ